MNGEKIKTSTRIFAGVMAFLIFAGVFASVGMSIYASRNQSIFQTEAAGDEEKTEQEREIDFGGEKYTIDETGTPVLIEASETIDKQEDSESVDAVTEDDQTPEVE